MHSQGPLGSASKRAKLNLTSSNNAAQAWNVINPTELNALLPDELGDMTESGLSLLNPVASYINTYLNNSTCPTTLNSLNLNNARLNGVSDTTFISNSHAINKETFSVSSGTQNFNQQCQTLIGIIPDSFKTISSSLNANSTNNNIINNNNNNNKNSISNNSYINNDGSIVIKNASQVTNAYPPNVIILPESQCYIPNTNNIPNIIDDGNLGMNVDENKDTMNDESIIQEQTWDSVSTQYQQQQQQLQQNDQQNILSISDETKKRLIQQQLVLLLHANKCKRRDENLTTIAAENLEPNVCNIPHCKTMKNILTHMATCQLGKFCKVAHCASSRQILTHWRMCSRINCSVCSPLKLACEKRQMSLLATTTTTTITGTLNTSNNSFIKTLPMTTSTFATSDGLFSYVTTMTNVSVPYSNILICTATTTTCSPLFQQSSSSLSPVAVNKTQAMNHLQQLQQQLQKQHEMQQQQQLLQHHQQQIVLHMQKSQDVKQQLLIDQHSQHHPIQQNQDNSLMLPQQKEHLARVEALPVSLAPPSLKEWHKSITQDLRNHLVHKLVKAIFPTCDNIPVKDKRIMSLVLYAKKVEGDMYEMANSKVDYYRLLAEKIFKIQKDLEDKRSKHSTEGSNVGANIPCKISSDDIINTLNVSTCTTSHLIAPSISSVADLTNLLTTTSMPNLSSPLYTLSTSSNEHCHHTNFLKLNSESDVILNPSSSSVWSASSSSSSVWSASSSSSSSVWSASSSSVWSASSSTSVWSALSSSSSVWSASSSSVWSASSSSSSVWSASSSSSPSLSSSSSVWSSSSSSSSAWSASSSSSSVWSASSSSSNHFMSNIATDVLHENNVMIKQEIQSSRQITIDNKSVFQPDNHPTNKFQSDNSMLKIELNTIKTEADTFVKPFEVANESKIDTDMNSTDVKLTSTSVISIKGSDVCAKKVWSGIELRSLLMPMLELMYKCEPESIPFRRPVDPVEEGIPDYFDIVKKPMDLSSIKKKLDAGLYSEPWEFIDDVWQMFENAWTFNKKGTKVHKYSTKLSEIFDHEIDILMKSLGYCCGHKHIYSPIVLICYGKYMCTIPVNTCYYTYQNRFSYCEKCFHDIQSDYIELNEDASQPPTRLQKTLFVKMKNGEFDYEPLVECGICSCKHHNICVLHMDQITNNRFICPICLQRQNTKKKENKFNAKRLPQTKLGSYLELRVNSFLKRKDAGVSDVVIRVLASSEKSVEVKTGMRMKFCNEENKEMEKSFPYIAKAIFAFMDVDGVDVCFFGMHVQEYGSALQPNSRRVYIAYMDSVNFFRPKHLRTYVYHELLIGYLDYVKNLGYMYVHIWACPPSDGDDYIFNCHPPDMKIPKPKRLQDWYKKMLNRAASERIIHDYKDLLKDVIENNLQSVTEIPYFEGDYWPNILEECIKELDEEEKKRKLAEEADDVDMETMPADEDDGLEPGKRKGQKGTTNSNNGATLKRKPTKHKHGPQRKGGKKGSQTTVVCSLTARLLMAIERLKEGFFVVTLQDPDTVTINNLHPIKDPDQFVLNDLMDGRDSFLALAREKHYEFSSLRRAKYSTMAMLYELHTQGKDNFVYTCNICKAAVETHYHCDVCNDFDLCTSCYQQEGHQHKMEKLGGLDLSENQSTNNTGSSDQEVVKDTRKVAIERCISSLVHACQCRDANCRLISCYKMKRIMSHTKLCKRKTNKGCPICRQLIALCCYHAKHCRESRCPVPLCSAIKQKLQLQKSVQAQMMKRRMAALTQSGSSDGDLNGSNATSGCSGRCDNDTDGHNEDCKGMDVEVAGDEGRIYDCNDNISKGRLPVRSTDIIHHHQNTVAQLISLAYPLPSSSSSSSSLLSFMSPSSHSCVISLHSSLTTSSFSSNLGTSNLKKSLQDVPSPLSSSSSSSTSSSLLSQLVASTGLSVNVSQGNMSSNTLLTNLLANKSDDDLTRSSIQLSFNGNQNLLSALLKSPSSSNLCEGLKYSCFNDNIQSNDVNINNNNIINNDNNLNNNIDNNHNNNNADNDVSNTNLNIGNLSNSLLVINTSNGYRIITNPFNPQLNNNNAAINVLNNINDNDNNDDNNNYVDFMNNNFINNNSSNDVNSLINVNGMKISDNIASNRATNQQKVFVQTILPTSASSLFTQQSDTTNLQLQLLEQQNLMFLQQKLQQSDQQLLLNPQHLLQPIQQQQSKDENQINANKLLIQSLQQQQQQQQQQPQLPLDLQDQLKQCLLQQQINQINSQQIVFNPEIISQLQQSQLSNSNRLEKSIKQPQQQLQQHLQQLQQQQQQQIVPGMNQKSNQQQLQSSSSHNSDALLSISSITTQASFLHALNKLLKSSSTQQHQQILQSIKSDPKKLAHLNSSKQKQLDQLQKSTSIVTTSTTTSTTSYIPFQQVTILGHQQQILQQQLHLPSNKLQQLQFVKLQSQQTPQVTPLMLAIKPQESKRLTPVSVALLTPESALLNQTLQTNHKYIGAFDMVNQTKAQYQHQQSEQHQQQQQQQHQHQTNDEQRQQDQQSSGDKFANVNIASATIHINNHFNINSNINFNNTFNVTNNINVTSGYNNSSSNCNFQTSHTTTLGQQQSLSSQQNLINVLQQNAATKIIATSQKQVSTNSQDTLTNLVTLLAPGNKNSSLPTSTLNSTPASSLLVPLSGHNNVNVIQQSQLIQQTGPQKLFLNITSDPSQQKFILQPTQQLQNVNIIFRNKDISNQQSQNQQQQQQFQILNINQLSNRTIQNLQILNQQPLQQEQPSSLLPQHSSQSQYSKQFLLFHPPISNNMSMHNSSTSVAAVVTPVAVSPTTSITIITTATDTTATPASATGYIKVRQLKRKSNIPNTLNVNRIQQHSNLLTRTTIPPPTQFINNNSAVNNDFDGASCYSTSTTFSSTSEKLNTPSAENVMLTGDYFNEPSSSFSSLLSSSLSSNLNMNFNIGNSNMTNNNNNINNGINISNNSNNNVNNRNTPLSPQDQLSRYVDQL